ncbi:MAG: hypothetical protein Q9178_007034 [Gyalolechia marmorata]
MPIPLTARRPGRFNFAGKSNDQVTREEDRINRTLTREDIDDIEGELSRCLANPKQAPQIYRERRERMAEKVEESNDRLMQANECGNEDVFRKALKTKTREILVEQQIVKRLVHFGIDVLTPNIKKANAPKVEPSDRKTRFGGRKRPRIGELIEGEPLFTTPRSKKRKTKRPYPSLPPTRPRNKVRKVASPQPARPSPPREMRSASPSPEEIRTAPPPPEKRFSTTESESKSDIDPVGYSGDPIVWNDNFSWNQPEGTGHGLANDSRDPDPIYEVKRINCRFKVSGTNTTEYWRNGKRIFGGPA